MGGPPPATAAAMVRGSAERKALKKLLISAIAIAIPATLQLPIFVSLLGKQQLRSPHLLVSIKG
jgi:hypothetical protein